MRGTGSYLPEKLITNEYLTTLVDTNSDWILERTGIRNRHIAEPDQNTTDLALVASQRALEAANLDAKSLDAIFFATVSPDQTMPSAACMLQAKLGCGNIMALDMQAACSGFVYAMGVANEFIISGRYKNILVVGAEVLTRYVNYKDRDTCILFGDGAGAFVMSRADEADKGHIYSHHLHADGYLGDLFELPMGGSKFPMTVENITAGQHWMKMKGREVFKNAVRTMSLCCTEALEHNKMNGSDVDWVVPHQANTRIIEAVAKHFGISMTKVVNEIENMGNISAATVPVAFDIAVRDGRIKRGQNLLLTAFGAGLTSGSLLMRY